MKLTELVGFRLVKIGNDAIIVEKGDERYRLEIDENYGDYYGNEIEAKLLVSETDLELNPVITNVEFERHDYDEPGKEYSIGKVTFFGVHKALAMLEASSFSDSGWQYGAAVTVICDELSICEVISEF